MLSPGSGWKRYGLVVNVVVTLDIHKTNVPDMRIQFRYQTLLEERNMVLHFDEPDVCFIFEGVI
jgi:hypothetical protein